MRGCLSTEKLEKGISKRGNDMGMKLPRLFGEAAGN